MRCCCSCRCCICMRCCCWMDTCCGCAAPMAPGAGAAAALPLAAICIPATMACAAAAACGLPSRAFCWSWCSIWRCCTVSRPVVAACTSAATLCECVRCPLVVPRAAIALRCCCSRSSSCCAAMLRIARCGTGRSRGSQRRGSTIPAGPQGVMSSSCMGVSLPPLPSCLTAFMWLSCICTVGWSMICFSSDSRLARERLWMNIRRSAWPLRSSSGMGR
mmetsp:Transcript_9545/g.39246  ORF Transcript_9545/g.39246 Transcript_9545/m.39246 type:complete len:218 (-) Transcript_9545:363-1016(-)